MTTSTPKGLNTRGRRFWRQTTEAFELDDGERELLVEVCRLLSKLDDLENAANDGPMSTGAQGQPVIHPAIVELRQQRLALAQLLGRLALPDDGEETGSTPAQDRARKAAEVRWSLERARRERSLGG